MRESESTEPVRDENDIKKETRGRPAVERTHEELVIHAGQMLGKHSQVDPKFQTETLSTRMTGERLLGCVRRITKHFCQSIARITYTTEVDESIR